MSSYSQYGVPNIDHNLKLYPTEIMNMNFMATLSLNEENNKLFNMVNVINMFTQAANLSVAAWYNAKLHYNNNISVIRAQICAND